MLRHFLLQHFVAAPPSGIKTKLNVGTQLRTFPIQRYQKRFHIKTLAGEVIIRTLSFKA